MEFLKDSPTDSYGILNTFVKDSGREIEKTNKWSNEANEILRSNIENGQTVQRNQRNPSFEHRQRPNGPTKPTKTSFRKGTSLSLYRSILL